MQEAHNLIQAAMSSAPVDSSSGNAADQVKLAQLEAVQSGQISEFVTGQQTNYMTFQDKFECLRFEKQSNGQDKIQLFQIRTPDPLHLTDPSMLLTVTFTRVDGIIPIADPATFYIIDSCIIDNLIKRVAIRYGVTQDQRNKADPVEILFKAGKLLKLSKESYEQDGVYKYGALKTLEFDAAQTAIQLHWCIPLWLIDSAGLMGTYKVYPANNLIWMEVEFEQEMGNIFAHKESELALLSYNIDSVEVFIRTTTVNGALKAGDVAVVEGLLGELEATTGKSIDPRSLSDAQTMADIIKSADKNQMNASSFISLLSTPTHFYSTNEIPCAVFNLAPSSFSTQTARGDITIQQQMVLGKSIIFYLRGYDSLGRRLPLPPFRRGPIKSFQVKLDGRNLSQFDQSQPAFQYAMLKHAVGRDNLGIYYNKTIGEDLPAIYGFVTGPAGNIDYETGVKTANMTLSLFYDPSKVTNADITGRAIARIDLMIARIYTQEINIDTNGQVVFVRMTV